MDRVVILVPVRVPPPASPPPPALPASPSYYGSSRDKDDRIRAALLVTALVILGLFGLILLIANANRRKSEAPPVPRTYKSRTGPPTAPDFDIPRTGPRTDFDIHRLRPVTDSELSIVFETGILSR